MFPKHSELGKGRKVPLPGQTPCNSDDKSLHAGVQQHVDGQSERLVPNVTKEWTKNIEICQWINCNRKWKKVSNLPICLNDESANIETVSSLVCEEAFHGEPIVLLDLDYLKLLVQVLPEVRILWL